MRRLQRLRNSPRIPAWMVAGGIILVLLVAYLAIGPQRFASPPTRPSPTETPAALRVLAAPVSQQQGNVTLTIVQAVADASRTLLIYRVSGLADNMAAAANDHAPDPVLRLAGSSVVSFRSGAQDSLSGGYYEYAPIPGSASDLVFEMARLPLVRAGAAPENWRIVLHLQSNPDLALQPAAPPSPAPSLLPSSSLAALIVRVQELVDKGYAGFGGKPGWIHMIDENYSDSPTSGRLRIETWYEVDAAGLVTRYVTWQRTLDGVLVQSFAAKGQVRYDFITKKSYPYFPEILKFDWGLQRSLAEDAPRYGYQVDSTDALCDGQPCLKVTLVDPGRQGQASSPRTQTEFQLSLATGRILQSQTTYTSSGGAKIVSGGRPVLVERADQPPAEVLSAFQPPVFP